VDASAVFLTVVPVGAWYLGTDHLDACQAACPLPIHDRWECGDWEGEPGGSVVLESGLSVLVAAGPFRDAAEQVTAAIRFLEQHRELLQSFAGHPSVHELRLRLWLPLAGPPGSVARVPRRLASLAAEAGVVVAARQGPT
jgi:hypothetical protein